ncbi:MAG: EamA family transporter [Bacilli bacterium]
MYIIYALLASVFSGLTSVFAKTGIKNTDSILATFLRTIVISLFLLLIIIFKENINDIFLIDKKTLLFLTLSGISNTLLWICYFKALDLGTVSKVTPVDKTSIVLTLILSSLFLNEKITTIKIISITLILLGTFLTIKKESKDSKENRWILYAVLTAVFTSTTTVLSKIGIENTNTTLITFLRTLVVLIILTTITLFKKKYKCIKDIKSRSWLFIILSGLSTSLSWLFYFKALALGEASIVFPIEKLSLVVSILISIIFLKEKVSKKQITGIIIIVIGTSLLFF